MPKHSNSAGTGVTSGRRLSISMSVAATSEGYMPWEAVLYGLSNSQAPLVLRKMAYCEFVPKQSTTGATKAAIGRDCM